MNTDDNHTTDMHKSLKPKTVDMSVRNRAVAFFEEHPRLLSKILLLRWLILHTVTFPSSFHLLLQKRNQLSTYHAYKSRFLANYELLAKKTPELFISATWQAANKRIAKELLPHPPFAFSRLGSFAYVAGSPASASISKQAMAYLLQNLSSNDLHIYLEEDPIGGFVCMRKPMGGEVSRNTIEKAYHLTRFAHETKINWNDVRSVIEWGGGYGGLARIVWRHLQQPKTYTLIDTPLFACLQWLYLATIFGEDQVHLLTDIGDQPVPGKINILSLAQLEAAHIQGDLFVSTWALSESTLAAQNYVVSQNWFNCQRLLLAFQQSDVNFPSAGRLGDLASMAGARIFSVKPYEGGWYAFR